MKIINPKPTRAILSATEKFVEFLAPTYGPAGKSILISHDSFNTKAVDDGKLAANEIELDDEFENAVIRYIQETTEKTDGRVGDGTTTSALIMGAIVKAGLVDEDENLITSQAQKTHGLTLEIKKGIKEAVAEIQKKAKKIKSKEELYAVAYNSYNNPEIAKLISETIFKIGKDGVLTIEDSQTANTTCELVSGLELEKGYTSPYLINNEAKDKAEVKNPHVLLVNKKINAFRELLPALKTLAENGAKEFLVVAEGFSDEVIGMTIMNRVRAGINMILVETPGFGDQKLENLKDLQALVGGAVIDEKAGLDLDKVKVEHWGHATSVSARKDRTVIMGGDGKPQARVSQLKEQLEKANKFDIPKLEKRIASLLGGVAVLKVGANTENEQKTIKAKVEDAVNATQVAFQDGVVPGAGKTLASIETSSRTLNEALKAPRKQLEANGKEFLDENVYDPAGVLIAALESAGSIACGLIDMGGISTTRRKVDIHGNKE